MGMLRKAHPTSPFRSGEYIHVSDILHKCNRMMAMHYAYGLPLEDKRIDDSLGLCFAIGDAVHDYMKGKVMRNSPDVVFGQWSCMCGVTKKLDRFANVRNMTCGVCSGTVTVFNELTLVHEDTKLVGNVDLPLLVDDALLLTEIKSIASKAWRDLVRPDPVHRDQVLIYWRMARELGYTLHDRVSVIYACKDYVFGNPYKEFVLQPSKLMRFTEDYFDHAREIKTAREGGDLPVRQCTDPKYKLAKECPLVGPCFND